MSERLDYRTSFPEGLKAMYAMEAAIRRSGLEASLLELVKMRASQLNGCAYCLDMHAKDARAAGESEQRLYTLPAWRDTPFFTARERAALAWTEALTNVQQGHVSDAVYEEARQQFSEEELVRLIFVVTQINAWNRICIACRVDVGAYQPGDHKVSAVAS